MPAVNTFYYDTTHNSWGKYAECLILNEWVQKWPNNIVDMCAYPNLTMIPAPILTKEKEYFLSSKEHDFIYFQKNLRNFKIQKLRKQKNSKV